MPKTNSKLSSSSSHLETLRLPPWEIFRTYYPCDRLGNRDTPFPSYKTILMAEGTRFAQLQESLQSLKK